MADSIITTLPQLNAARRANTASFRLESMRGAALELREHLLTEPSVRYYRSMELVRVPYPSRYAFLNCDQILSPYIHILNRLFVVQVDSSDGIKTLLLSPSDVAANAETPYFRRMIDRYGPLAPTVKKLLSPQINSVEDCLAEIGLAPEQVDYISYDHLHTQDLRRWLGNAEQPGLFPNAKLLVMTAEWQASAELLPPQRDWYCPGGIDAVPEDRVICLDGDVMIGDGLALIQTPGHTMGNHSFVAHTAGGLKVTSENGVGPDCYAPEHSAIAGLAAYAHRTGMEVIMNGNTLEFGLDQYISMVVEKTLAGPHPDYPDFPNMANSSELTAYWAFPGYKPTVSFGNQHFGRLYRDAGSIARYGEIASC